MAYSHQSAKRKCLNKVKIKKQSFECIGAIFESSLAVLIDWPYLIIYVGWICDMSVWTNYFWLILGRVKRKNAKKGQSGGAADDEDAED